MLPHPPSPTLFPYTTLFRSVPDFAVFGDDYDTPDGTAIRDYIHVSDLASAHIAALSYLSENRESTAINLGTGRGYSVFDLIDCARQVTGKLIEVKLEARRAGDPSRLVADDRKARDILNWRPA